MPDKQPDKNEAAETRPVPSKAEGEESTVDESLWQKEQKQNEQKKEK